MKSENHQRAKISKLNLKKKKKKEKEAEKEENREDRERDLHQKSHHDLR